MTEPTPTLKDALAGFNVIIVRFPSPLELIEAPLQQPAPVRGRLRTNQGAAAIEAAETPDQVAKP